MAHRPWVQVSMACFCVAEQEVSQPAARPNLPGRKKTKTKKTFPGRGFICLCSFFCCVAGFFLQLAEHCSLPALKACKRGAKGVCVCVCLCFFFFLSGHPVFPILPPFPLGWGANPWGGGRLFSAFFSLAPRARAGLRIYPARLPALPHPALEQVGPEKKNPPLHRVSHGWKSFRKKKGTA